MCNPFVNVFNLADDNAYQRWQISRETCSHPSIEQLLVEVADPFRLKNSEKQAILARCSRYNMAIYRLRGFSQQPKTLVSALGRQLGLQHLDANLSADEDKITSLQVMQQPGHQYIPYTNKALSWHTDGYYNKPDRQINAIIMHCVSAAAEGGVNHLLDHEQVYMYLRDENPAYIKALMHPQAMTIPANEDSGRLIRAAQSGPVFSLHKPGGRLHMRFSARKRNIIWRDDAVTIKAVKRINALLDDTSHSVKIALKSGQGIICNNVLHNRSGFYDSDTHVRLMYRARYYDRIT